MGAEWLCCRDFGAKAASSQCCTALGLWPFTDPLAHCTNQSLCLVPGTRPCPDLQLRPFLPLSLPLPVLQGQDSVSRRLMAQLVAVDRTADPKQKNLASDPGSIILGLLEAQFLHLRMELKCLSHSR